MPRHVDDDFRALTLDALADAALETATRLGAEHVLVRVGKAKSSSISVHDHDLESASSDDDLGMAVRVVHNGAWGFAASGRTTVDEAVALAHRAVALAEVSKPLAREYVELAPEPAHGSVEWVSPYEVDPFDVSDDERTAMLLEWTGRLLASPLVQHADATLDQVKEATFIADSSGTRALQQRVRVHPTLTARGRRGDLFDSLRSLAPPVGRGLEYLRGVGWDWDSEIAQLPELLDEKLAAPSVEPGLYDLIIDATNLWLTIHESVGHATELDRALGYEANYAGTSFATPDLLDSFRYGSPLMNVTADRTAEHGLASVGWDDEGVKAQQWDLVRDGILTGYQLDRATAARSGLARSNGCAFADSAEHVPMQRMANVSLAPDPDGPDLDGLVAGVDDGILVLGDGSWSIDMQRFNFQFTGQRFHRVQGGKVVGQLRDVAYQGRTPEFWGSMRALGGPSTYRLMGAFNCGKGQPGQVAPVSHGTPAAVFTGVNVLNATAEAGQ